MAAAAVLAPRVSRGPPYDVNVRPYPVIELLRVFIDAYARWIIANRVVQNTPEWFAERKGRIGASSMAIVLGWGSHEDVRLLWMAFRGFVSRDQAHSDEFFSNHGHAHEGATRDLHYQMIRYLLDLTQRALMRPTTDAAAAVPTHGRKRKIAALDADAVTYDDPEYALLAPRPGKLQRTLDSAASEQSGPPPPVMGVARFGRRRRRTVVFAEPGMFISEQFPFAAASPDVCQYICASEFLGDRLWGLGEYKCPIFSVHCSRLATDELPHHIPPWYMIQMQAQMWIIGRQMIRLIPGKDKYEDETDTRPLYSDFVSHWVANERCPVHKQDPTIARVALLCRVYQNLDFAREMARRLAMFANLVRTDREPDVWWDRHPYPHKFKIRPLGRWILRVGETVGEFTSMLHVAPVEMTLDELAAR